MRDVRSQFVVLALCLPLVTFAGGGGSGIVFDPTNFIQNTISAVQSVNQVRGQIEQIRTQYQQYANELKQSAKIDGGTASLMRIKTASDLRDIQRALDAYTQLGNSVQATQAIVDGRLSEAKLMGVSWDKYMQLEDQRIATNKAGAVARVESERRALKQVDQDYEFARDMAAKIPSSTGMHQAVQQSNIQLNRLVTQNAEILRVLAQANGAQKAEEMAQQAQRDAASREAANKLLESQRKVAVDPRTAVSAFEQAAKVGAGR